MDFREVIDTITDYAGQASGGQWEVFVKNQINRVYFRILDTGEVPHEHREFSLTTEADVSQIGLPLYVRKVLNIEDPTNSRFVWETTARAFDRAYPGNTESGTPRMSYPLGVRGVQKYPASDGVISFRSDSAADTGANYKMRITGFSTAGVLITETVALAGTTDVDTVNQYDSTLGIERITKNPATGVTIAGNITVTDTGDNTLAVIPVWWDSPDYQWIEFHPIPSAAVTYTLRVEMRKPPLVNDTDWPEFDQEFHDLLIWGVTQDLLPTLGKGGVGDRHRLTFRERIDEFKQEKDDRPNAIWVFSNVQSRGGIANRPHRPLIDGVDIGLATGQ